VNQLPNPTLGRRALIRNGAITVSLGALAAACGTGRTGSDAPGRLGVAGTAPGLVEDEVTDITFLRTAQSIEYTAIDVYAAAAATDGLSGDELTLVQRFVDDHQRHADSIGTLLGQLGGEPFTCANPFLVDRAVTPVLAALDGTDDLHRDLLNIAYAFEALAGATYQEVVRVLADQALRAAAMQIGGEEQRHAAVIAAAINPATYVSPTLTGGIDEADEYGIPLRYSIPSVFGRVDGIELTVGAVNEEGSRFSTSLQTPAANSLIYSDQSC
jgi:rubrerythrin